MSRLSATLSNKRREIWAFGASLIAPVTVATGFEKRSCRWVCLDAYGTYGPLGHEATRLNWVLTGQRGKRNLRGGQTHHKTPSMV